MSKHKLKQFLFDINSNKNDNKEKPEKGKGKEYSVVVLLSGYPYGFYDKTQESYEGLAVDIMQKIFKDLKLKTKIKWVSNDDVDFNQTVKDVAAGKYDIGIGNFSVNPARVKLINYTHPLYLTDASLVYRTDKSRYSSLIKNILKTWLKPFSIIFILAIIIGLISYYLKGRYSSKKSNLRWHLWGTLSALLGEPGTVIDNSDVSNRYSIFLGLFILALTFYIGSYLTALTTSTAIKYTTDYDPFNPKTTKGIENKRILVNKGTNYIDEVKQYKGIPVLKERGQDGVELIIKHKDIDGYLNDSGYLAKEKEDRPDFKVDYSIWPQIEIPFGTTAFIVNKNQTDILRQINLKILKLQKIGYMERQCNRWIGVRPNKKLCRL